MDKIKKIVDEIYDPKMEDPRYQTLMASCIKAWIRNGIEEGIKLGREELALELDITIKKNMNPGAKVIIWK